MDIDVRLKRIESEVTDLRSDLLVLRDLVGRDHGLALNKMRFVTEKVLLQLCRQHEVSWGSKEPTIEKMFGPLVTAGILPRDVATHVRAIQNYASPGSHYQEIPLADSHVRLAQMALLEFLEWHYRMASPEPGPSTTTPAALAPTTRRSRRPVLFVAAAGAVALGVAAWLVLGGRERGGTEGTGAGEAGEGRGGGWRGAVETAVEAGKRGEWEQAARHLAEAKSLGAPAIALPASLTEGVAAYEAPPTLDVDEPADGVTIPGATFVVAGRLRTGRPTDRVEVGGMEAALVNGRFELTLPAPVRGRKDVVVRVTDRGTPRGEPVRRQVRAPFRAPWEAYLDGWAEPVGDAIDAATRHPRRIRRVRDGGEMLLVPAGTFLMGAVPGDAEAEAGEKPRHEVTLSKAYYLDEHEVTNEQFARFAEATAHVTTAERERQAVAVVPDQNRWGPTTDVTWRRPVKGKGPPVGWDRLPVVLVGWTDAVAFTAWAGVALPTEAQFERAIRAGTEGRKYPWGDAKPSSLLVGNYADASVKRRFPGFTWALDTYDDGFAQMAPVRSFPPNAFGFYDLGGNVWEWCADAYDAEYYARSPAVDPTGPLEDLPLRVVRGGSWFDEWGGPRVSVRVLHPPGWAGDIVGFRCAKSLP